MSSFRSQRLPAVPQPAVLPQGAVYGESAENKVEKHTINLFGKVKLLESAYMMPKNLFLFQVSEMTALFGARRAQEEAKVNFRLFYIYFMPFFEGKVPPFFFKKPQGGGGGGSKVIPLSVGAPNGESFPFVKLKLKLKDEDEEIVLEGTVFMRETETIYFFYILKNMFLFLGPAMKKAINYEPSKGVVGLVEKWMQIQAIPR